MEPSPPDHYSALGLDRRCTAAQIRAAYRLLTKRHHPDVNGGSAESLACSQQLNAAHEILSDPARRRAYDRDLAASEEQPAAGFTGRIERNVCHDLQLRLEDFFRGTAIEVRVNDPANAAGPEAYELCVPPETAPGTRFRIPRTGQFAGGYVVVRVHAVPNARFKARGSDLRCDFRISSRRAAEGGSEMITGPLGMPVRVEIPTGVARGAILRVSNHGLPKPRGGRGDLLVRVTYRVEVRTVRR